MTKYFANISDDEASVWDEYLSYKIAVDHAMNPNHVCEIPEEEEATKTPSKRPSGGGTPGPVVDPNDQIG